MRSVLSTTKPSRGLWSRIRGHWLGVFGLVTLLVLGSFAVLAPLMLDTDPTTVQADDALASPGGGYLLGTDQFGRDVAARLAVGVRLSLLVAFASVTLALVVGSAMGIAAGYIGKRLDEMLMRTTDVLLSFPYIVLAIALAAALGAGLVNVIVIITVLRLPHFARVARGAVLTVKHLDYIMAARALGQRRLALILRHIVPNCLSPLMVIATVSLANAITAEAALGFLGLGITPPTPSLGNMLSDAQQYVLVAPGLAVWPGLAITLLVLGMNLVGDSLQERLDPRLRVR